ncbi:hypothetical protein FN846DRAFT_952966 [Sphaerosporella brunnea]|uniref:Protein kinase domain-containing protein n=1 Tax=Sphaerosporella brunnea TaxID=1250544 RepID=A0A5J5EUS6_9PEZI|nr:hypothetical protein FN846DRAFT_952966 [Sphaerosporella brunnea]
MPPYNPPFAPTANSAARKRKHDETVRTSSVSDERAHPRYNLRKHALISYAPCPRAARNSKNRPVYPHTRPSTAACRTPTLHPPTPPLSPPARISPPPPSPHINQHAPCTTPRITLRTTFSRLPSPPPGLRPIYEHVPRITPYDDDQDDDDAPRPYPALPRLSKFTCTLLREVQITDAAAVLLVSLPDSSQRILKLFPPPARGYRDLFAQECAAYAALLHHEVPNVPHCYGVVSITCLRRQVQGDSTWHSKFTQHRRLRGLLLDYILDATTVMAAPERLVHKPALVKDFVDALRRIHAAGVMHRDALPRNMMIDLHDRVWWVDFGSAACTASHEIDPRHFEAEGYAVWDLLGNDVIPAAREGRTAEWVVIGA